MGLKEVGRTGVQVNLSADGVFGVVTQDPESMLHSMSGLEYASGNSGYGQEFTLTARVSQTASGTSTTTFAASNSPFKFRVIDGEVECLQDALGRARLGSGRASVNVMAGSTGTVASINVTEMRQGEVKPLKVNTLGNEVVDVDGSLSVAAVSVLPEISTGTTWELLVKLRCLRVI